MCITVAIYSSLLSKYIHTIFFLFLSRVCFFLYYFCLNCFLLCIHAFDCVCVCVYRHSAFKSQAEFLTSCEFSLLTTCCSTNYLPELSIIFPSTCVTIFLPILSTYVLILYPTHYLPFSLLFYLFPLVSHFFLYLPYLSTCLDFIICCKLFSFRFVVILIHSSYYLV